VVSSPSIADVPGNEIETNLNRLEAELKRLEAEYNMFFAGRLPKPPWETRSRVDNLVKGLERGHMQNFGDRFRLSTLQARYSAFIDLWDRGLRAREEGRPGPFTHLKADKPSQEKLPEDRVLFVAAFHDPATETDKLRDLYDSLAELVKTQVDKLKASGSTEVAFRVAMKDGKVNFTARALHGAADNEE
jgi:hypothetical protein